MLALSLLKCFLLIHISFVKCFPHHFLILWRQVVCGIILILPNQISKQCSIIFSIMIRNHMNSLSGCLNRQLLPEVIVSLGWVTTKNTQEFLNLISLKTWETFLQLQNFGLNFIFLRLNIRIYYGHLWSNSKFIFRKLWITEFSTKLVSLDSIRNDSFWLVLRRNFSLNFRRALDLILIIVINLQKCWILKNTSFFLRRQNFSLFSLKDDFCHLNIKVNLVKKWLEVSKTSSYCSKMWES